MEILLYYSNKNNSQGFEDFHLKLDEAGVEYEDYRSEYEKVKESQKSILTQRKEEAFKRIGKDLQDDVSFCSVKKLIRFVINLILVIKLIR